MFFDGNMFFACNHCDIGGKMMWVSKKSGKFAQDYVND